MGGPFYECDGPGCAKRTGAVSDHIPGDGDSNDCEVSIEPEGPEWRVVPADPAWDTPRRVYCATCQLIYTVQPVQGPRPPRHGPIFGVSWGPLETQIFKLVPNQPVRIDCRQLLRRGKCAVQIWATRDVFVRSGDAAVTVDAHGAQLWGMADDAPAPNYTTIGLSPFETHLAVVWVP